MKEKRRITDAAMVLLLPCLMAYSLIGEAFHEIAGTAMIILFLFHHRLNRAWMKNVGKGTYTPQRVLQTVLDAFLLVFMIVQPACGILMSKHLYPFLSFPSVSAVARAIHLPLGNWGFILMSIHAGTHLGSMLPKGAGRRAVIGILAAISVYGACAFVKRQIPQYLFLKMAFAFFDYSDPVVFFLLDYLAVMILFAMIGYAAVCLLGKRRHTEVGEDRT